jgi:hypothetical protein
VLLPWESALSGPHLPTHIMKGAQDLAVLSLQTLRYCVHIRG